MKFFLRRRPEGHPVGPEAGAPATEMVEAAEDRAGAAEDRQTLREAHLEAGPPETRSCISCLRGWSLLRRRELTLMRLGVERERS